MDIDEDFCVEKLELADDYEGKVVASLIKSKLNEGRKKAVLYIHGFVDYFFQAHVAEEFHKNEFDFFALDLRKYGRSLLAHQKPNYCEDLSEYFEEIDASLEKIGSNQIHILGHSTGGLIACYYAIYGNLKSKISGLILNSPFLEIPQFKSIKSILQKSMNLITKVKDDAHLSMGISPVYPESIHKDYHGEWDFNLNWKPIKGFTLYFHWFDAVAKAQEEVKKYEFDLPILILHSDKSLKTLKYTSACQNADIVLNVDDIKRIGTDLGGRVELAETRDAIHDIFLSKLEVRRVGFQRMFDWLDKIS